jgi:hypothetical protein
MAWCFWEEGHMEKASKGVAWICIFSTLVMGCKTTHVVGATDEIQRKVHSGEIVKVLAKDGTEYVFERPATVVHDTIVGRAQIRIGEGYMVRHVSLPLSTVASVSVREHDSTATWLFVGSVVLPGLLIWGIASFRMDMKLDFSD